MRAFASLYEALDRTTSTSDKVAAMTTYLQGAAPADAAWAVWFLAGNRPKGVLPVRLLATWACEEAALPGWLFEESYGAVGDLAETAALLVERDAAPTAPSAPISLDAWMNERILPLRDADEPTRRARIVAAWHALPLRERFVLNKLLTGELRVGVSKTLVVRAIARVAQLPETAIAQRLMGDWQPSAAAMHALLAPADAAELDDSRPYPFALAAPLEGAPEALGPRCEFQVEWKWDGIRCQLIRRAGALYLWSRGEELLTDRFPELAAVGAAFDDGTVLDGEVLAWRDDAPLPFAILQQRIGRKKLGAKILATAPVAFLAYDLLEDGGIDVRARPLAERRALLEAHIARAHLLGPALPLAISELLVEPDWAALAAARAESRARGVEGLMLKRRDAPYLGGRKRGPMWKWKVDPFTVDAVLVYAQPGSGKRSNLLTDYTFAVWDGDALVPMAKAYTGLSNDEIAELDKWLRAHTVERFGPVRSIEPHHVFELAFEGIAASPRHRGGVALRFPRMARWRRDKPASEADRIETLRALIGSL